MFTLKLYRNASPTPSGRTVVMEVAGLWVDHCDDGVKHVRAFRKTVGVMDELGTPEFYVGGNPARDSATDVPPLPQWDNYYDWGVLENAQGKTTEMLR